MNFKARIVSKIGRLRQSIVSLMKKPIAHFPFGKAKFEHIFEILIVHSIYEIMSKPIEHAIQNVLIHL